MHDLTRATLDAHYDDLLEEARRSRLAARARAVRQAAEPAAAPARVPLPRRLHVHVPTLQWARLGHHA